MILLHLKSCPGCLNNVRLYRLLLRAIFTLNQLLTQEGGHWMIWHWVNGAFDIWNGSSALDVIGGLWLDDRIVKSITKPAKKTQFMLFSLLFFSYFHVTIQFYNNIKSLQGKYLKMVIGPLWLLKALNFWSPNLFYYPKYTRKPKEGTAINIWMLEWTDL